MKPGTQADLRRELKNEHGITCSAASISQLVTAEDYRIIETSGGKIKIQETAKALIDSGFGKRTKKISKEPELPPDETEPVNGETEGTKGKEVIVDIQDYIRDDGKLSTTAPRAVVARYKEMQSAEKDRIKNEKELKTLVDFNGVVEKVFNFLRPFRNDLQEVAKRVSPIAFQAGSKHKAEKAIDDEIKRIFVSRVGNEYSFDDYLKKKIIQVLSQ